MPVLVKDLMDRPPVSVGEGTTVDDAVQVVVREGVYEVYVTDRAGRLAGVVSDYELLKANLTNISGTSRVTSLMSRSVKTFRPDTGIDEAASVFRDGRYTRVAVLDDDGRPIGQVTRRTILQFLTAAERQQTNSDCDGSRTIVQSPSSPLGKPQCLESLRPAKVT